MSLDKASVSFDNNDDTAKAVCEKQAVDSQVLVYGLEYCSCVKWHLSKDLDGDAKEKNYKWAD